jgi:hypothetical protein
MAGRRESRGRERERKGLSYLRRHSLLSRLKIVKKQYVCFSLSIIFTVQYWTLSIQQLKSNANNNLIDICDIFINIFFTNIFITILGANSIDIFHEAYLLTYFSQIYSIYNYSKSQCC